MSSTGPCNLDSASSFGCGDGGVIVTNDDALATKLRLATDKAYDRTPGVATREPKFLANNYRMTELQAAVAIAQLDKLSHDSGKESGHDDESSVHFAVLSLALRPADIPPETGFHSDRLRDYER